MRLESFEDERTKVSVHGYDQTLFLYGPIENLRVGNSRVAIANFGNGMTQSPQSRRNRDSSANVDKHFHLSDPNHHRFQ